MENFFQVLTVDLVGVVKKSLTLVFSEINKAALTLLIDRLVE